MINKPSKALALAVFVTSLSLTPSSAQSASNEPCVVDEVRKKYNEDRGQVTKRVYDKVHEGNDLDDVVDFEEKGCISSYGLDGSFSIESIASSFLSGIRDAVCSAADNYLADQVDGLSASIDAPLGLSGAGIGINRGSEGVNIEQGQNEIDFNAEGFINDQFDRIPNVNPGYTDYEYDSDSDIGDENYLDQDRTGARR